MNTTIAIGCLVQWFEEQIIEEYVTSLNTAINQYEGNVIVDFCLVTNQDLEKPIDSKKMKEGIEKIKTLLSPFNLEVKDNLYTIADYRRDFSNTYSDISDVIVWGESDMLVPKQFFNSIDAIHSSVNKHTPKYLLTYGICKMWDDSWKILEHPKFTDKVHSDSTEDWWGVRYSTSIEEMNSINDGVENLDVLRLPDHKFNGCGLVIASEVIKSGANIPKSIFFIHEDTAFLNIIKLLFKDIPQYHIRNIFLPHNRKHPKKRFNIKGEENIDKTDLGKLRRTHSWYSKANELCEVNAYNFNNPNFKSYSWEDVFNEKP